jgi:hypothetical protein
MLRPLADDFRPNENGIPVEADDLRDLQLSIPRGSHKQNVEGLPKFRIL